MAKYTLHTFCGPKLLETFGNRSKERLVNLLMDERMNPPSLNNAWGDQLNNVPTRFELYDGLQRKVFEGTAVDAIRVIRKLR